MCVYVCVDIQVTIGPWIENGFYYDFDVSQCSALGRGGKGGRGKGGGRGGKDANGVKDEEDADNVKQEQRGFSTKDLNKIKKEMGRIIRSDMELLKEVVSREEAERRIQEANEPYKMEILGDIPDSDDISIFHTGTEWWDLCAGPHVASTGVLDPDAIMLEEVAGAYWRGDEKRPMLQRIYGTAFETPVQLERYKMMKAEAARRDHRKLGQELSLFSIEAEEVGGGLVLWMPKGSMIRHIIESFWKDLHLANGYELVYTPHIAKSDLWKTSGHASFYKENMYETVNVEDEQYQLRPMNCPFHVAIFKSNLKSYRDLPVRYAELGTVYRYERSGTMHGLFRVRGFTQDDAHVFCTPEQIREEIGYVLDLTKSLLSAFGFTEYQLYLSTRPEKSVGSDEVWNKSEEALKAALHERNLDFEIDEGGGAFYGPKIDLKIRDAIGRSWQCSTVQVDFNLPARFGLEYVSESNERQVPILIHRALLGSIERFFGVLVENYAGAFPVWLSPVQLRLVPVSDSHRPLCDAILATMRSRGIRCDVSPKNLRLGKAIRNGEMEKIPVMGILGNDEADQGELSIRTYADGDLGRMKVDAVCAKLIEMNISKDLGKFSLDNSHSSTSH